MGYWFYQAANNHWIREQEIGIADSIRFANFTSCIGVVAEVGKLLWGAHLCMFGGPRLKPDGSASDEAVIKTTDVAYLRQVFPAALGQVYVFGWTDVWRRDFNDQAAIWNKIEAAFSAGSRGLINVRDHHDEEGSWLWLPGGVKSFEKGLGEGRDGKEAYGQRLFSAHEPRTAAISHA